MATSSSKRRTMHKVAESAPPPSYSAFFPGTTTTTGIPKHTVFYAIYPDEILQLNPYFITKAEYQELISSLHSIHLRILDIVSPYITDYIWQHEHFSLSISSSSNPNPNCPCSPETLPHFHGKTKYGENLEDEWFIVFLLFQVSRRIRNLTIRVWDSDGEFLLFESAEHLFILDSSNTKNRVFIRGGELHIVHDEILPSNAPLVEFLSGLARCGGVGAPYSADSSFKKMVSGYPERAQSNMHRVKVRVPVSVAKVLKHEPCLISLAVEGFCNRDSDSMKFVINMEKFQSGVGGTGKEELIRVSVRMSRAMYAKLAQQTFEAPECYPMPPRTDSSAYVEAMLGMKIACGFEMMYQQRRHEGMEVKGSTWEDFKESLKSSGYFQELLPKSRKYRRLLKNAQEYYTKISLFSMARYSFST
ncbi:SGT1 [Macleaya cordata]|uniref:SGT1 n=1 Tax=Macleaya cordata TaxID=56857 RepID=A0A200PUJ1_MACCD|nr:SGT1 [Macleaya cordata]